MTMEKRLKSNEENDAIDVNSQARKISWIVAVVIIIISIFIAIVCSVIYNRQPSLPIEYDYIMNNWQLSPIIQITPSNVGCDEYFTSYVYPGTVDGCNCQNSPSLKYSNQIFTSQCTSDQLSNNCNAVNSTPTQAFNQWKLQNQILQLCVMRAIGFNYMKSDCSQVGYKRCGVAKGDTTNPNMFCIPSNVDCPINSIIYGPTAPDYTYSSIIDVGGTKIFTSSESISNKPIAYSHISRGKGECKDFNNYHYVDSNMKEYILIRGRDNTCTADQTDNRFKSLFQINEKDYIQANRYDSTINALPSYPYSQNMQYYFLTREYIPWNQLGTCRFTHMPYFIDLESKTDKVSQLWVGCIIVNWFVAVVYGMIVSGLRLKLNWKIKNWYIIPTSILLLIQTVLTIVTFAFSVDVNQKIKDISNAKCSDQYTNDMISKYSDDYNTSVLSFQIVLLVFVLILMIFTLFFMKTIFIIIRLYNRSEVILPQSKSNQINKKSANSSNKNKQEAFTNELLEEREQNNGGYDNTYAVNGHDGNTMYPHQEGSDGSSNQNTNLIINNVTNNGQTQQETTNVPLIKVKDNPDSQNKQKGVLKRGGEPHPIKQVVINNGPSNNKNNNNKSDQNVNVKVIQFDDDHYNKQFDKNKDLENLYASNPPAKETTPLNVGKNQSSSSINDNIKSNMQEKNKGKTMEMIQEETDKLKFNTTREGKSKNDLLLQVNQTNLTKSQNNFSQAQQTPSRQDELLQENIDQNIKSFAQIDNLLDNNEWEFEIDDYVKKHREQQQSTNRIGGGYEIGKPREKYLQHKFQRSTTRKLQSQHSIEAEHYSPEKLQQLNPNRLSPHQTQNFVSTSSLNQPLQGNVMTENAEESDRQNNQLINQKLP